MNYKLTLSVLLLVAGYEKDILSYIRFYHAYELEYLEVGANSVWNYWWKEGIRTKDSVVVT